MVIGFVANKTAFVANSHDWEIPVQGNFKQLSA